MQDIPQLIQPIQGTVLMIVGPRKTAAGLLLSTAIKLQRAGPVLFIDAAESFSTHFLRNGFHQSPEIPLTQLQVAQPLTLEQFQKVINNIDDTIGRIGAKAIIVTAFERWFDEDLKNESDRQFAILDCLEELKRVSRKHQVPVCIGASASPSTTFVEGKVAMVCKV